MSLRVHQPTARQVALAAWQLLGAAVAQAAGFQISETSVSDLGSAFAGGAAEAADASIMWSNAAGLSRIRESQVSGALHLITPSLKFRNVGSAAATGQGLGGNGGDAGGLAGVPNFYVAKPLPDQKLWIGLGVTAPWGLVTEYDAGWVGRFQAIKSAIKTININPSVAWEVSPGFALGLGLSMQHMAAEFTNQVNYSGALLSAAALSGNPAIAPGSAGFNAIAAATPGLESSARIKGSDNAYGWNAGLLFDLGGNSRVGLHYRSSLKYRIDGNATFANPAVPAGAPAVTAALAAGVNGTQLFNTRVTSEVEIPAVLNLSYFTRVNDDWDVMADLQWTQWSTVKDLIFVRADGSVLQSTPENFKNTWKLALGANYRYSPQWTLRGGIAFDKSPVQAAFLTPRLPDADRTFLALGARYTANPRLTVDVGAGYAFVKKARINANGDPGNAAGAAANGLINGYYDSSGVILSAQLNYAF